MDPQCNRQLGLRIARSLGPYVKVEAVFTLWSLVAVAPFGSITARIVNRLIAWVTELVGNLHALPSHNWLRLFPAEIANRRCSVWNAAIDVHVLMIVGKDALYLTTLDGQNRILWFWLLCSTCNESQQRKKC